VIYLMGSLRNPEIPRVAQVLRDAGHTVYDDWYAVGPEADTYWQAYERERGRNMIGALKGWHAEHVFENDKQHLDEADTGIMIAPCGRSGHLELGYLVGCGKKTYILLNEDPDRYDIMYKFADGVFLDLDALVMELK